MIQGKIWGTTSLIFRNGDFEVHRIHANAGGFCSIHEHTSKFNLFYIESGKLEVSVFKNGKDEPSDDTILIDGMSTIVNPGEVHRFRAIEDTIAYEIYWTELDPNDIVRYREGGFKVP